MKTSELFSRLWDDYVAMTPQAAQVKNLVEARFGPTRNDHVALRTFDRDGIGLRQLELAFLELGYRCGEEYEFPDKHLLARGYLPPTADAPLVFISELLCEQLSTGAQAWIESHPPSSEILRADPMTKLLSGRTWAPPTFAEYQALEQESPYAAWLSVWGLCANHFTIAVHELRGGPSLLEVVDCVRQAGFSMNEVGGVLKGSPEVLLEQASTLAEPRPFQFACGATREIPSSYYEFAKRYPEADGSLYRGFVPGSATNIFESTTEQNRERVPGGQALARE